MKRFEQLTIRQIKKEIIAWETEMGREPKTVEVVSVGQHSTSEEIDANIYMDGPYDNITMEFFFARIIIDGEEMMRYYVWNCDEEEIYISSNEDPQEHNEKEKAAEEW